MNRYTHDDATYEVIMRKSRASLEPFWGLNISKYLTHVSSEHITSWVLLSMTSTAGETSHVLLAYIMLWINIASLALYIARIIEKGLACETAVCHTATNLKFGRCTALSSPSLWLKHLPKLVTIDIESRFCISMIWHRSVLILLTTFYHMHHQLLGIWSSVSYH